MIAFFYAYLIIGFTVWLWMTLETDHVELSVEVAFFCVLIFAWLPLFFVVRNNMVSYVYLDNMAARKKQDFELYGC